MKNIVLVGYMGSGKTTIGANTALRLGMRFVDTDKYIERMTHSSITSIFDRFGENTFRLMENLTCRGLATSKNAVIATGGGIALHRENIDCLKYNSLLIYLRGDTATLYSRAKLSGMRPLAGGFLHFLRIYNERKPLYEGCADVIIDIRQMSAAELSRLVIWHYCSILY